MRPEYRRILLVKKAPGGWEPQMATHLMEAFETVADAIRAAGRDHRRYCVINLDDCIEGDSI